VRISKLFGKTIRQGKYEEASPLHKTVPPPVFFHAKKCKTTQVLPLTWLRSLSTLRKTPFGDYSYEVSYLQQSNDSG